MLFRSVRVSADPDAGRCVPPDAQHPPRHLQHQQQRHRQDPTQALPQLQHVDR